MEKEKKAAKLLEFLLYIKDIKQYHSDLQLVILDFIPDVIA